MSDDTSSSSSSVLTSSSEVTASSSSTASQSGGTRKAHDSNSIGDENSLQELGYQHQMGCWPGFWNADRSTLTSSYFLSTRTLLIWRAFAAIFSVAFLIADIVLEFREGKLFIVLTVWSICLLIIYFMSSAALTAARVNWGPSEMNRLNSRSTPTWYERVIWVLYTVSAAAAAMVTILFWALLFRDDTIKLTTVVFHGINMILMVVEMFLNEIPYKLSHVVFLAGYGVTWVLWSAVYQWWWGRLIYDIIDWNHWLATTGWIILGFTCGLLCYVAFWATSRWRDRRWGVQSRVSLQGGVREREMVSPPPSMSSG
eukprot:TRINITY_DN2484_c0_g1_i2.p1 TRINITY_DN2484_c0_g1~~TRINITY_DN2484_c0_g1_i2.p1  ORF type:complete len:313 (+),score=24.48 TRINITY_DN2484_c0_g1_i2:403-1341(+)